jgi:hypothetical protein
MLGWPIAGKEREERRGRVTGWAKAGARLGPLGRVHRRSFHFLFFLENYRLY